MEISTRRDAHTLVAMPKGRIESSNAEEFDKALQGLLRDDDEALILDMGQISYMSSAGLRVVAMLIKTARERGMKMAVCALTSAARDVFFTSGFHQLVSVHETQEEATSTLLA